MNKMLASGLVLSLSYLAPFSSDAAASEFSDLISDISAKPSEETLDNTAFALEAEGGQIPQNAAPAGLADIELQYTAGDLTFNHGGRLTICTSGLALFNEFTSSNDPRFGSSVSANSAGIIHTVENRADGVILFAHFPLSTRPAGHRPFDARFFLQSTSSGGLQVNETTAPGLVLDTSEANFGPLNAAVDATALCADSAAQLRQLCTAPADADQQTLCLMAQESGVI